MRGLTQRERDMLATARWIVADEYWDIHVIDGGYGVSGRLGWTKAFKEAFSRIQREREAAKTPSAAAHRKQSQKYRKTHAELTACVRKLGK